MVVWALILAGLVMQGQTREPESWKQKFDAAVKAEQAGLHAKAEQLLLEVVADAETLGRNDLRLASPLERLGHFYMDKRWERYTEAERMLRRALVIREQRQGPAHVDTARTLVLLATCQLAAKGKEADSVGIMLRRALAIIEKSKGRDDPEVAAVLNVLGGWHLIHGETKEAESAFNQALDIHQKALPPENEKVADLLDHLGIVHMALANAPFDLEAVRAGFEGRAKRESEFVQHEQHGKKAKEFFMQALAIREKILKPDDQHIAESLYNLGQLATLQDQPADAEQHLHRWLSLREKAKAPADEKQVKALMMWAAAAVQRKDWAEAENRLAKSQAVCEEVVGHTSDEVSGLLSFRATVAISADRFDDAEKYLKRSLEILSSLLGRDDSVVTQARALMAGSYQDHARDRRAPLLWHKLDSLSREIESKQRTSRVGEVLSSYADLLRKTNIVVPQPDRDDLDYLKKIGAVWPSSDLARLATTDELIIDRLDEKALPHIARLYSIEKLDLSGLGRRTMTADEGVAHIQGLINLKFLDLSSSGITDLGLAHLANLESLEDLDLGSTRVGNAGLAHLKGLKELRRLRLCGTNVTDAGLEELRGLEHLATLNILSTKVSQHGVARLQTARPSLRVEYTSDKGFAADVSPVLPSREGR